jgi:hypothetical protein
MKTPPRMKRVYLMSLAMAVFLFAIHTWVLFEMAVLFAGKTGPIREMLGLHLGGPLVIMACFLVLFIMHIIEAGAWALFFWKEKILHSASEAFYFCGVSITGLGYGDVVLKAPWRVLGPIMATNGILMFGCSTAFLFLIIQRILEVI